MRIPLLPLWVMPSTLPSVYDSESKTIQEMTARLHGTMRSMIEDYNKFAEQLNKEITEALTGNNLEIENFKRSVEQRLCCKFQELDTKIAEFRVSMKDETREYVKSYVEELLLAEVSETASELINQAIRNGTITITEVYDPNTESLNMVTTGGVENV